jgi:hypothetical protein
MHISIIYTDSNTNTASSTNAASRRCALLHAYLHRSRKHTHMQRAVHHTVTHCSMIALHLSASCFLSGHAKRTSTPCMYRSICLAQHMRRDICVDPALALFCAKLLMALLPRAFDAGPELQLGRESTLDVERYLAQEVFWTAELHRSHEVVSGPGSGCLCGAADWWRITRAGVDDIFCVPRDSTGSMMEMALGRLGCMVPFAT